MLYECKFITQPLIGKESEMDIAGLYEQATEVNFKGLLLLEN